MDKEVQIRIDRNGIAESGRLGKNASEKKFDLSKPGSVMYATPSEVVFDGETGNLIARSPIEKHIGAELKRNPDFVPKIANAEDIPSLVSRMDDRERELYGKTFDEMEIEEFLANSEVGKALMAEALPISEVFTK